MKRLIGCISAISALALVFGLVAYFVIIKPSPAKKLMKEHPYTFATAKALGTEEQDSYTQENGCVYIAYPKTKNKGTDETLQQHLTDAKAQFDQFLEETAKKDAYELIPRLIFDYETAQKDTYTALTCTWKIEEVTEEGTATPVSDRVITYYIGTDNTILDLNGLLGEDSEKKINLMLKSSGKTTDDLQTFTVEEDTLTLRWADSEEKLSVSAVQRAGMVDPDKPMIALTFDDGPGRYSRDFADLLTRYGGRGTFFVLGMNVENFAEDLKYVYDQGNEIASHTMRHKNLNILSEEGIHKEIDEAAAAIHDAIGVYPALIRTPYGNANKKVMNIIDGPMIKWSVDTEDWKSRNAEAVKNEILAGAGDGEIILMHEIYKSTYEGLELALAELSKQGYQFVTVSEMMQYRGVTPTCQHYYSFEKEN
ncbi:MAG: polysaccharide deacetylase family protein [Clostridia bacterium]|nr:polysaccharide deacetylase family protein [Clostridia bacterium]